MKNLILIFVGLQLMIWPAYAQQEYSYLDKNRQPTDSANAYYVIVETYRDVSRNAKNIKEMKLDGTVLAESEYSDIENGTRSGRWTKYYENGQLYYSAFYVQGNLHGDLKTYFPSGQLKRQENYRIGEMVFGKCFDEKGKEISYFPYETKAEPMDGMESLYEYISKNLVYPREARKEKAQGKVMVSFVVDEKGNITEVEAVNSVHPLLDEEAVRIIRMMPKWLPSKVDGTPTKAKNLIPITFKL